MKKSLYVIGLILFSICSYAQKTPESYLGRAPQIPQNVCTATYDEVTQFNDKIRLLKEEIQNDANRRTEAMGTDENKQKVAQQYLGNSGLSAEDIAKAQSGNMSEVDAAALGAKVAAGMGQNNSTKSSSEIRKENAKSIGTFAFLERYTKQIDSLTKEQTKYYTKMIVPIELEKAPNGSIEEQAKWNIAHQKKLLTAKKNYCEKFSPKRLELVRDLKTNIKQHIDNFRKYQGKQM